MWGIQSDWIDSEIGNTRNDIIIKSEMRIYIGKGHFV